jgi:hypothetical protein
MIFSEQIFEAIVVSINYRNGTCSLSPIDANSDSTISEVPLPHYAGNGNSGMFYGIHIGTRVVAMFTSGKSRDVTVITGLIPKPNLHQDVFQKRKPSDVPNGTFAYPSLKEGQLILRGDQGSEIDLNEKGDVIINTVNGGGTYLKKNNSRSSFLTSSEDIVAYSNASKTISGSVRRMSGIHRNLFPKPDLTQTPLFADPNYAKNTTPYAFFTGSQPLRKSYLNRKRNVEMAEYRMVINEFSTDYMFTGFDNEVKRALNDLKTFDNAETHSRNREQGNTLHLAEHELIEVIGGNVVDINGNVLDINYNTLLYGRESNRVPNDQIAINYDRARRISRRGIGYHFQLATNSRSTDKSTSQTNFVWDLDKEGMLKVNIPASSDTGNIPFVSSANFVGAGDSINISYGNPSFIEPVPVTLRDENGEIVYPDKNAQGITHRKTGVRYNVGDESPYFPTQNDSTVTEVRVNTTKYHNMFAAAERLIANTIKIVNIPPRFLNDAGFPEGLSVMKPFEVPIPNSLNTEETTDLESFRSFLSKGKTDFPTYMGVVAIEPGPPAIYSGGGSDGNGVGTLIAGKSYLDENKYPPYSNAFNSSISGDEVNAEISNGGEPARPVGGKSAHFNLEGSIEASIGKDNYDQKSLVLDTAGSIISWLGKDKNGRSMVMQTDGDFLLNIGGSYDNNSSSEEKQMNKGRFELRVNVVDKKFVSTQFTGDTPERGGNPGSDSDLIISMSEEGFVIAGMMSEKPMIIRNKGPILMESSDSDVTIKGVQVKTVSPKGAMNVAKPPTRNS